MNTNRRKFLMTSLFGAGCVGLRAVATGLPVKYFLDPDKAFADTLPPACQAAANTAQFLIMSIDQSASALNANVPGTYDAFVVHPSAAEYAKAPITLAGKSYNGNALWKMLPQATLDRSCFFHASTQTTIHPDMPKVLGLMGATYAAEMLPSLISNNLASCLGTLQAAPVSLVGTTAAEYISFQGRTLPNMNAIALKNILTQPAGPLTNLQSLRDKSLDAVWNRLKTSPYANTAQRNFIDSLATSRQQVRSISQSLLSNLSGIVSNDGDGQVAAAVALIQMKIAPVIVIRIGFGGDNHSDPNLQGEADEGMSADSPTKPTSGVPLIADLMAQLTSAGLQDKVTFATLNVFGRTLSQLGTAGRNHWAEHQVSVMIGSRIKGGVVGGLSLNSSLNEYTALPIDSASGQGNLNGDIPTPDLLASFGKTLCHAVGLPQALYDQQISRGKAVTGTLL